MKEYMQSIPEAAKLFLTAARELGGYVLEKADAKLANAINGPEDES